MLPHLTSLFVCLRSVVLVAILTTCARADIIEIRVPAYLYKEPDRHSERIYAVSMKDHAGPFVVTLLEDEKINGYYHVRIPGKHSASGWVYKSYVRRFRHGHPDYVPYIRSLYKHWIDADGDCQDTRAEVLTRDSKSPTLFSDARDCQVGKGDWLDPYTGKRFGEAGQLDIDHMVPLKNAHESGAWAWTPEKKALYANYLDDIHHLLAVSKSENRRKGDRGPDRYLPPNTSYQCEYVRNWVKVKEDWELEMTDDEGKAVDRVLAVCQ